LGMAWAWLGHGLGMAWAWLGHGLGMAWAWLGHGLGMAWAWLGHGLGIAWALLGHCLGIAWALLGHELGHMSAWESLPSSSGSCKRAASHCPGTSAFQAMDGNFIRRRGTLQRDDHNNHTATRINAAKCFSADVGLFRTGMPEGVCFTRREASLNGFVKASVPGMHACTSHSGKCKGCPTTYTLPPMTHAWPLLWG